MAWPVGAGLQPAQAEQPVGYSEKLPECEFEELALVTSKAPNDAVSIEDVTEGLRMEARKLGGDAVIRVTLGEVAQTNVKSRTNNKTSTTADGYQTEPELGSSVMIICFVCCSSLLKSDLYAVQEWSGWNADRTLVGV